MDMCPDGKSRRTVGLDCCSCKGYGGGGKVPEGPALGAASLNAAPSAALGMTVAAVGVFLGLMRL